MKPYALSLAVAAAITLTPPLFAEPIPGLFNTGLDAGAALLEGNGQVDGHYQLVESPDDGFPGPEAVSLNPGFPVGPWLEEGPDSRWIAPSASQNIGNAPGFYTYRTTFDLSAFDISTVRITGRWATDDGGRDIIVNGVSTNLSAGGFTNWTDFELTQDFVQGTNTLEFVLENGGEAANPTGLRVEMSGEGEFLTEANIPGLFSTGLGEDGNLLGPNGEVDAHYQLVESADEDAPGPDAVTLNPGFPVGPWLAEGADSEFPESRWIAPVATQNIGSAAGEYRYRTTFSLAGFNLNTVRIAGRWATDNGGLDILLNDESLGFTTAGFTEWSDFEITEGFVAGENTLDFLLSNAGDTINPTGIRVEILEAKGDLAGGAPPSIVTQPASRRVIVGEAVALAVTAGGSPPFVYQWQRDGEDLPGGNTREFVIGSASEEDAGGYAVRISNGSGEVVSDPAAVTVFPLIPGLFGTGVDDSNNALDDLAVDPHYTLVENADGEAMEAIVHDSMVFPIIEGPWVANTETSKWIAPRGDTAEATGGRYSYRVVVDLTDLEPSTAFVRGRWATDNAGVAVLLNGAETGLTNDAQFGSLTSFVLEDAPFISGVNTLDFVVNNAGAGPTALRVDGLTGGAARAEGGDKPPVFVVEPSGAETFVGESVTLISLADGTPPLSYVWRHLGDTVGEEAELSLANLQPDQAGEYVVEVSNNQGSITSTPVTITILEPIPDLFNTGVDDEGNVLEDLASEPHYQLVMDPNEEGLEAIVLNSTVFPIVSGPWVPNNERAKWIGVREDNNGPEGDYLYRITFDLSAFDPDNVFIEGDWATDNAGGELILNGESTGIRNQASFTAYTHFRIEEGFVPGINTLDIPLNNAPSGDNPTGLIVDNLRGGGQTEDPNLIGPSVTPFGQLAQSAAQTIMVPLRNSGRTQTLAISQAQIVGANAGLFTLGDVPAEIAPSETIMVAVSIDPQGANGNFDAALELTTNDPSTPVAQFDISAFIPVAPNLIAHYKLDETGGDRLTDASGFGRNGSFNATAGTLTFAQDQLASGTATAFSEGAYAEVGSNVLPIFEDFTFSLWFQPNATNGATSLISRGDGQGDPFALVTSDTNLLWFSGGAEAALQVENAITAGETYHIAVVGSPGMAALYIDGIEATSGPLDAFIDNANHTLQFGAANGILGVNGRLDDIQIYDRPLTADEVATLFSNPGQVIENDGGGGGPTSDLPSLIIARNEANIELSWPVSATDYQLHQSDDLLAWPAVTSEPSEAGGRFKVTVPLGSAGYFRLEK